MDSFNKIVSFVLGLVVVIVFLAVITGRLSPGKSFKWLSFRSNPTPTAFPSPSLAPRGVISSVPTAVPTLRPTAVRQPTFIAQRTSPSTPKTIPATGSPTLLLPLLFSSLGLGIYLKGKK